MKILLHLLFCHYITSSKPIRMTAWSDPNLGRWVILIGENRLTKASFPMTLSIQHCMLDHSSLLFDQVKWCPPNPKSFRRQWATTCIPTVSWDWVISLPPYLSCGSTISLKSLKQSHLLGTFNQLFHQAPSLPFVMFFWMSIDTGQPTWFTWFNILTHTMNMIKRKGGDIDGLGLCPHKS